MAIYFTLMIESKNPGEFNEFDDYKNTSQILEASFKGSKTGYFDCYHIPEDILIQS